MANEFVSWAVEYKRAKDALATRSWNSYFMSSIETREETRTTYTLLGNIQAYIQWLAGKAAEEASGEIEDGIFSSIGGC